MFMMKGNTLGPVQSSSHPPLENERGGGKRAMMFCQLLVITGGTFTKFPLADKSDIANDFTFFLGTTIPFLTFTGHI
jgi:hypothetical protein